MEKLSVKSNSGQALLVILLIMAVVLTIGLATISRSVTDIKISEQTEDSARAFSAAEAGVEAILSGLGTSGINFGAGSNLSVNTSTTSLLTNGNTEFLYPEKLNQNEVATIWLTDLSLYNKATGVYGALYNTNDITFAWGNSGYSVNSVNTPAMEVSIYYNSGGIKVAKFMLDPNPKNTDERANGFCKADVGRTNCPAEILSFSTSGTVYGGQNLQYLANIKTAGLTNMYFARLRMLYNDISHSVGVKSATALPSQGDKIAATGTSNQATRKVEVYRLNPAPPDIFDFALYSGGSLVK